jgi:hypothetical protein
MTGQDIYNGLIGQGVPAGDARILSAVAYGESGYQTGAVGDGGDSIGLFQINVPAHYDKLQQWTGSSSRSVWESWLKVPENNLKAAAAVYDSQGLGAWTVYNTGAYRQYLDGTSGSSVGYSAGGGSGVLSGFPAVLLIGIAVVLLLFRR